MMILNGIPISHRTQLLLLTPVPELMEWMRTRDLPLSLQFARYGIPIVRKEFSIFVDWDQIT